MNKECTWTYCDIDEYWMTECGEGFTVTCDTPEDHGFKFCPYCGGSLSFVIPVDDTNDDLLPVEDMEAAK